MSHSLETLSLDEARQLILHGQALLRSPAKAQDCAQVIRELAYLQLDSINVLERAHHLTLGTRMDHYRRPMLKQAHESERALFEDWTHDACLIPIEFEAHWQVRRERFLRSQNASLWWRERMGDKPERIQREILSKLEIEGPLPTRAFRREKSEREPWWGWAPEKAGLEYLWRSGRLAISGREGFEKVYDLAERVLPQSNYRPSTQETLEWCCREALQRLGLATTAELAAFWHFFKAQEIEAWCREELEQIEVEGKAYWLRPDYAEVLNQQIEAPKRLRLLCPFDPLVRHRDRLQRFFGFSYRFEAFVPKAKRRFGYYVLPMLSGRQMVGRLDAKFLRKEGVLSVLGCWWEEGQKPKTRALEQELQRLKRRIGAQRVLQNGHF